MSSGFQWGRFQTLGKSAPPKEKESSFEWGRYESLPQYDAAAQNQEQEGTLMAAARNLLQIPKGAANLTGVGATLNALGALGTGEALAGREDEFSEENIARLRQLFPTAPWENFDEQYGNSEGFREKYLEGTQAAASSFPTVENISRGIESATGIPLESKSLGHELIQLGTGLGSGLLNKLTTTPSKFSNVVKSVTGKNVSEKTAGTAIQQQLGKKFSQGEIIAEGRRVGLTDAEIAPLLNSERRVRFLSKFARKGSRSEKALSQTKDKIGNAYDTLKGSELAAKPFAAPLQRETLSNLHQVLKDLPDVARQGILKDTELLLKEPHLTARNLIGYRQKIQQTIKSNPSQYGTLSTVKKVVDDAILKSSPQLAKEYHGLNRLYEQYAKISSALKPNIADKFVSKGEALATLYGVLTLNIPLLSAVGGEGAARRLVTEVLINPRFQQLSSKFVSAVNENKVGLAAKLAQSISKDVRPYSDELADEIEEIDWESF